MHEPKSKERNNNKEIKKKEQQKKQTLNLILKLKSRLLGHSSGHCGYLDHNPAVHKAMKEDKTSRLYRTQLKKKKDRNKQASFRFNYSVVDNVSKYDIKTRTRNSERSG